ncbi:D-alanine--D-alanine ligase [Verrucomicrobia bacterium]|nr:D-alanine--D-alanine ligase [Verrucomicrobiota bacterium]
MNAMMHITVLMGGDSTERDVSLRSGQAVIKALTERGHQVSGFDPVNGNLELPPDTDLVFLALHGSYGEDGSIQDLLESMGMPYTGSGPISSRLAFDKLAAKHLFEEHGLSTPPFIAVKDANFPFPEELGLPLVVKPVREGSSVGLRFVHARDTWPEALEYVLRYGGEVLVERCIPGRELTVAVLDGKACPIVEIKPNDQASYDYEHKYTAGATRYFCPADLESTTADRCKELALAAYRVLGCEGYGRVDLMLEGNQPFLLEVNTLPGMTETSLLPMAASAAGMPFPELCEWMASEGLRRHQSSSNEAGVSNFR